MKNSKLRRILLTLACAVLLVSLSVGATLAYLTSTTDVVQNTFTVGKVAITLDEGVVDENGQLMTPNDRTTSNQYKIMPGHAYHKDPIVHVAEGSEDCYIFVRVSNGIAAIEDPSTNNKTIAQQMTENGWVALDAENYPGVFYYTNGDSKVWTASMGYDLRVFTSFAINPDVINGVEEDKREEGKLYITDYTNAQVTIVAYAIQADGFNTPADAWAAGNW